MGNLIIGFLFGIICGFIIDVLALKGWVRTKIAAGMFSFDGHVYSIKKIERENDRI